jgi:serine phosphatase RsbU (regulator of sigma subunit)
VDGGSAEHDVATALQRVLLPPELPDVPGWAMATLYEPAGETVLVGGDFYDWFVLPNGHVLVVVGDVSGKGPLAGALGMSIRKALKGAAWVTGDAAAALPVLQQALADEFAGSFATLVLVELVPGVGRVRLVLAGHPPPWVRRGGRFAEVEAPANAVLGPGVVDRWEGVDLELRPGDQLVLFTDGLTEARLADGSQFGDGPLQELLTALPPGLSSYETVLAAYDALRGATTGLSDDVVVGVLAFSPPPRTGRRRSRAAR